MITHMIQSETKQLHLISFTFPALIMSHIIKFSSLKSAFN